MREALADRWIIVLVLLGLAIRTAYALRYNFPPAGDQLGYLKHGRDFGGYWHSGQVFRTPGYPAFLAAIFELGLGRTGVLVAQGAIVSAGCYMAAAIAAR